MPASFAELGLSQELLHAIEDMGFEEPSPIQLLAIPPLLSGRDAIGQAQTGTGKTAAFGLPVLDRISPQKSTQSIILCPTRELAVQVAEELGKLGKYKKGISIVPIYGGQSLERQFRALEKGPQVIVGTPGRIIDHLKRGTLRLHNVFMAVLDEADEMLDMGFREDIELILREIPPQGQKILFSATMPQPILELSEQFLNSPEILTVAHKTLTVPAISQTYYEVRPHLKLEALCRLLDVHNFHKTLVFCSTKRQADEIATHLQQRGYQADALHGDLNQTQRERVMGRFKTASLDVMVATDVAARGIDVEDVDAVINCDIPHDVESYVHRIGRTGRAGREGKAFTFVTAREHFRLRDIIRYTKARIVQGQLPTLRDVHNIRTSKLLDEVRNTLAAGTPERWLTCMEAFLSENYPDGDITSRDVAAALLEILMKRDFGVQTGNLDNDVLMELPRKNSSKQKSKLAPRRTSSQEMVRIQFNVGHTHKATPGALVGAITGETGISGRDIGAIDIRQRSSSIEIKAELVEPVLNILNHGVYVCGIRITAVRSAPADNSRTALNTRRSHTASIRQRKARIRTKNCRSGHSSDSHTA